MVIESGVRQRIRLAPAPLAEAASAGDLDAAARPAGQACRELERCEARWLMLPEQVRRELPAPGREQQARAELTRRFAAAREEKELLLPAVPEGTDRRADQAAVPASRSAQGPAAAAGHPPRPSAERACGLACPAGAAAEVPALRDLAAAPSQLAKVHGWLRPEHFGRAVTASCMQ
jgi:hypothetical protein